MDTTFLVVSHLNFCLQKIVIWLQRHYEVVYFELLNKKTPEKRLRKNFMIDL
jgi:hypothetical protein